MWECLWTRSQADPSSLWWPPTGTKIQKWRLAGQVYSHHRHASVMLSCCRLALECPAMWQRKKHNVVCTLCGWLLFALQCNNSFINYMSLQNFTTKKGRMCVCVCVCIREKKRIENKLSFQKSFSFWRMIEYTLAPVQDRFITVLWLENRASHYCILVSSKHKERSTTCQAVLCSIKNSDHN